MSPDEPPRTCPRCHAGYEPLQEYCLECGARLPVNHGVVGFLAAEWQRRFSWYPGDWIWPVLLFLVLTIAATTAAVAASTTKTPPVTPIVSAPPTTTARPTTTAGPTTTAAPPTATARPTTTAKAPPATRSTRTATTPAAPPPPSSSGLTEWPAGRSGYTIVLESLPGSSGHGAALARARTALRNGLPSVGILVSAQYSSLRAGYTVVFSGVYGTQNRASAAIAFAHAHGFPDAYQARISR